MNKSLVKPVMLLMTLTLVFGNIFSLQPSVIQAVTVENTIVVSAIDKDDHQILEEIEVDVEEEYTVYDAIEKVVKQEDVDADITVDEGKNTIRIGDSDLETNWNIRVNNEPIEEDVASFELHNGDVVLLEEAPSETDRIEESPKPDEVDVEDIDKDELEQPESDENTEENDAVNEKERPKKDNDEQESTKQRKTEPTEQVNNEATKEKVTLETQQEVHVKENIQDIFNYIEEKEAWDGSKEVKFEFLDEWFIWGLVHTDYDIPTSKYIHSVEEKVKETEGELGRDLDLHRVIVALSLLGEDATDFGGYNLIDKLENKSTPTINFYFYSLIAVDSGAYDVSDGFREEMIEQILSREKDGGGWSLDDAVDADPTIDITAMALASLAPYQDNPDVKEATDRAVNFLSEAQEKNGGYLNEWGNDSAESVSQVIIALASLGIDPLNNEFVKEDGNLLGHLEEFKTDDHGYTHDLSFGKSMGMPTSQALLAYVAYQKFTEGTGSVYKQTVKEESDEEEVEEPKDPSRPKEPEEEDKNDNDEKPGPTLEDPTPNNKQHENEGDPSNKGNEQDESSDDQMAMEISNEDTGNSLPQTATSIFNYVAVGLLLIVVGLVFLVIKRRKSVKL